MSGRSGRLTELPSIKLTPHPECRPDSRWAVVALKRLALDLQEAPELWIPVGHLKANRRNGLSMQSDSGRNAQRATRRRSLAGRAGLCQHSVEAAK